MHTNNNNDNKNKFFIEVFDFFYNYVMKIYVLQHTYKEVINN